jgi:hypothetical protein
MYTLGWEGGEKRKDPYRLGKKTSWSEKRNSEEEKKEKRKGEIQERVRRGEA